MVKSNRDRNYVSQSALGRKQVQNRIVNTLRAEIVEGKVAPGERLPGRPELGRRFEASPATVQSAMHHLMREGFIEVGARRGGTRVCLHPPHLTEYKLIFPYQVRRSNTPGALPHVFHLMEDQAHLLVSEGKRVTPYYGISEQHDVGTYQRLVDDVHTNRLAGLLFASSAHEFRGTPLLEEPGICRAAVAYTPYLPGVPKLFFDMEMLVQKALEYFRRQGRSDIAVLCPSTGYATGFDAFLRELPHKKSVRGIRFRANWMQYPDTHGAASARRCVELLLDKSHPHRPDGLLILDDHLVRGAAQGILESKVKVPQDLEVVAHANFPSALDVPFPIKRIGFDISQLVKQGIEFIDRQHNGETPPELTLLPALLEDELE